MSSLEPLREVVKKLADTFNNLQKRESYYFDFYDDSLIIHGCPPNLPVAPKETASLLEKKCDQLEIITKPATSSFHSVSQYYKDFV